LSKNARPGDGKNWKTGRRGRTRDPEDLNRKFMSYLEEEKNARSRDLEECKIRKAWTENGEEREIGRLGRTGRTRGRKDSN
jgi:hypothetical protein